MTTPVLEVADLSVSYRVRRGPLGRSRRLRVVDGVSFSIDRGEVLALVGESGSGKSTVARAVLRLLPMDEGRVVLNGVDISRLSQRAMRPHRSSAQMVFQDPYSSLDPLMTASEIVTESLRAKKSSPNERHDVMAATMASVGLSAELGDRYPHEFSGGQRQRIAIARALALQPDLVVCDEPVSALDLSTQNQVISLLDSLRHEREVAYLFISHDLSVVRQIADRIAVMYSGQIVEEGPTERVFEQPTHPYTLALLSAIPKVTADKTTKAQRIILTGDLPKPGEPPPGCRFNARCPFTLDMCRSVVPLEVAVLGGGIAACHLHEHGPRLGGSTVAGLALRTERNAKPSRGAE